jgi:hypothetical protein
MVVMGRLKPAAKGVRQQTSIKPRSDDTFRRLTELHPPATSGRPGGWRIGHRAPPRLPTEDSLQSIMEHPDRDVAPGSSGWTPRLKKIACTSPAMLKAVHTLTILISHGAGAGASVSLRCLAHRPHPRPTVVSARLLSATSSIGSASRPSLGTYYCKITSCHFSSRSNQKGEWNPSSPPFNTGLTGTSPSCVTHLASLDFKNA